MAIDWYEESLKHKGLGEQYGEIKTKDLYSEGHGTITDILIRPEYREVTCLADFFKVLKEIHTEHEESKQGDSKNWGSLFLYRGQGNLNYTYTPSIVRSSKDLVREHLLCKELHRRFFDLFDNCKYMMEEECLMQHFGLGARVMDLLEHPLIALWAACETESNKEFKDTYGEVSVWCLDDYWEELKTYDSSTVSVIANTAKMEDKFILGNLENAFIKEQPALRRDFLYLKDVLRRTAIVLPKFNNQRIKNQQSAFAVINLNELIDENHDFERKFGVSVEKFSDYIMNAEVINKSKGTEFQYPNVARLREGKHTLVGADFSNLTSWDLVFRKLTPSEAPYVDSFDLYKYLYKGQNATEKEWHPVTIVVPPKYKADIEKELKYLNITEAFIYPEMDKVALELKKTYGLGI